MSLMGYTEEDVIKMKISVDFVLEKLPKSKLTEGLTLASDFLEGLLVEGRV